MSPSYWAATATQGGGPRTGVLAVNLGTPAAPTPAAVRRYLAQFLGDRRVVEVGRWLWYPLLYGLVLPRRARRVARAYARIWGAEGSPLLAGSRRLAAGLQAALPETSVELAMTYGEPSVAGALRSLQRQGCARVLVLPLFAQYSATTTAAVFDAVAGELRTWRVLPELRLVRDFHRDAAWVQAVAGSLRSHWREHGRGRRLLFSLHGIPQRYADAGDPYPAQCRASAQAIAVALELAADEWALAYQSRVGREPWLQPYTESVLRRWADEGVESADVVCPGFAVDCLETLEEIAVESRAAFLAAGGRRLSYVPALNDAPEHVQALAALVRRHCLGWENP